MLRDKGVLEFEEAAPHVVPAGDEAQAQVALLMHPVCGLPRIAQGVAGLMAERNTARSALRRGPERVQQLVALDPLIDPRDEQLLRGARGEQLKSGFEPQPASGQDDDRIGRERRVARDRQATRDKKPKTSEPQPKHAKCD